MKKLLILLGLIFLFGCGTKKSLISPEFVLTKAQEDIVVGLKSEIDKVQLQMGKLLEANVSLQSQINLQTQLQLQASLDSKIQGQAGVGNTIDESDASIQAGGNVEQTTNEKELMMYAIGILGGLLASSITGFIIIAKKLIITERSKKDYKDNFLMKCINNEKDLAEFRLHHEKIKRGVNG